MRVFIVCCLLAVASADKLGYNYHPVGHSDSGLSFAPGGSSGGSGGVGPAASGPAYSAPAPVAEYEKEFYTYSADENDFSEPADNGQGVESLKKNLRVIFIKGPEGNGLEKAAANLARHVSEEKTAIYVLQKQADLGGLANQLQAQHDVQRSKPEVHFVKYRTPEDAANAQRAIQQQYDQLEGKSQSHDGGVAPVHNYASPAAQPAPRPVSAPGASYLPSSILRF
uniref:Mitochondrial distribution and morphology protein 34 n=1 Tax=Zeugodacus cucurbitae TaxID=28588 RepID=A0A0A1XTJ8_ZEUCU